MATAVNTPPLTKFKCQICNAIPGEPNVKQCSNGHIICVGCCYRNGQKCQCKVRNLVKIPNPILGAIQTTKAQTTKIECPYAEEGCSWLVSEPDAMADHRGECKFRPYKCVGAELGIWTCDWSGMQQDFGDHMKECHSNNGAFFTHWQQGILEFDPIKSCAKFNLIDAFNKKFAFLYIIHEERAMHKNL